VDACIRSRVLEMGGSWAGARPAVAATAARTRPLRLPESAAGTVRLAAGLGLLNGLVYQGLGGSFEDSRHPWLLLGLLLAADRIERGGAASGASA
jgi:hypothetical protein